MKDSDETISEAFVLLIVSDLPSPPLADSNTHSTPAAYPSPPSFAATAPDTDAPGTAQCLAPLSRFVPCRFPFVFLNEKMRRVSFAKRLVLVSPFAAFVFVVLRFQA